MEMVASRGLPAPFASMGPQLRKAFAEDALAIASLAASEGFAEDAAVMRRFAIRLDPQGIRRSLRAVAS